MLSNTHININAWTHVGATYDGSNMRFYLNGVADGAPAFTESLPTTAGQILQLDGRKLVAVPSAMFEGRIDDVRYYERVLTATDMAELYAYPRRAFSPVVFQ